MSDDPVPLLHYIDMRFDALEKAVNIAREADQRAQDATLAAMNLRLQAMNEFRKTVEDVITKTVTRQELGAFLIGTIGVIMALMMYLK